LLLNAGRRQPVDAVVLDRERSVQRDGEALVDAMRGGDRVARRNERHAATSSNRDPVGARRHRHEHRRRRLGQVLSRKHDLDPAEFSDPGLPDLHRFLLAVERIGLRVRYVRDATRRQTNSGHQHHARQSRAKQALLSEHSTLHRCFLASKLEVQAGPGQQDACL
jgi:hypothetical protein